MAPEMPIMPIIELLEVACLYPNMEMQLFSIRRVPAWTNFKKADFEFPECSCLKQAWSDVTKMSEIK